MSTDCVHSSSINMFNNKIYKYLVMAGYTIKYSYLWTPSGDLMAINYQVVMLCCNTAPSNQSLIYEQNQYVLQYSIRFI